MKHIVLTTIAASLMTSCIVIPPINGQQKVTIKESDKYVSETFEFSGFDQLITSGCFILQLIPSETEKVEISCYEPLLEYISAEQSANAVELKIKNAQIVPEKIKGQKTAPVAKVYFKNLSKLEMSGASEGEFVSVYDAQGKNLSINLSGASDLEGSVHNIKNLKLNASGASEMEMNLTAEQIKMDLSGASEIKLSGSADSVIVSAGGAGEADIEKLKARSVELNLSGASKLSAYADEKIQGTVGGAGELKVYGNPVQKHIKRSGASEIKFK